MARLIYALLVISIHALLAESDRRTISSRWRRAQFLSTLSLRRATHAAHFFSFFGGISIHALLAESDAFHKVHIITEITFLSTLSLRRATAIGRRGRAARGNFYPRSPCGERRLRLELPYSSFQFLSTLSLRRATHCHQFAGCFVAFLSTLSLRRATVHRHRGWHQAAISIHALLAESDLYRCH